MNSKISLLSKKRMGMKNKIEDIADKIEGFDINIQKLLEDVWGRLTNPSFFYSYSF